jgi:hypothetical protein
MAAPGKDATADELFEMGEDVDALFESGDDVQAAPAPESIASEPYGPMPQPLPEPVQPSQPKDPGFWRTVVSGGLQGFFKGGSDEAIGGITRAKVDPGVGWRQPDGSVRMLGTEGDVYRAGRNTEREVLRGAEAHRPKTAFTARVAGDLLSDLTVGRATGGLGSGAYNVATGALTGFLGNDADLSDGVTEEEAVSAGLSTVVGGATGDLATTSGAILSRMTPAALRALRTWLENRAVSQGRRVLLNGADSLAGNKPVPDDVVREALDSGAIMPLGTTQGAFKRLEGLAKDRGEVYASILEELEKKGVRGPEAAALAAKLAQRGQELMTETGANKAVPNQFMDEAANIENLARGGTPGAQGPMRETLGLTQSEKVKRALQEQARYGKLEDTPINEAKKEIASTVREANEEAVERATATSPDLDLRQLGESFKPVKQTLGRTIGARDAAERGATAAAKRRGMSLSDYMAAGMGSGLSEQVSLGALNNFMRNRGTSTFASTAYGLSRAAGAGARAAANNPAATRAGMSEAGALLGRNWLEDAMEDPQTFGKFGQYLTAASAQGPEALSSAHWELAQNDPEYQEHMRRLGQQNSQ